MDHQRQAERPRRETTRGGHEPTHAEHHQRTPATQNGAGLPDGGRHPKGRAQPLRKPLPPHTLDTNPLHVEAVFGYQTRLHPAAGADPKDLQALPAQTLGDGEGRKHMTAGATGHDPYARTHRNPRRGPASVSACRTMTSMRSSRPIAIQTTIRLLLP